MCVRPMGVAMVAVAAMGLLWPVASIETGRLAAAEEAAGQRSGQGLLVLYDFSEESGPEIADRSGAADPIPLVISDMQAVRRSAGSLEVHGETVIRSQKPPVRVIDAVRRTGAITLEAWVQTATTDQKGPARIVTLSADANERNVTLGQEGDRFDVRFRTTKTTTNGMPSLATDKKTVTSKLTHVVFTRHRSGETRLYLDGQSQAKGTVAGAPSNWDGTFQLALANEVSTGRPWRGTYRLVALYDRALSATDVERHFRAGPQAPTRIETLATKDTSAREQHFIDHVAAILSRHCFECHDSAARKGGLDLSRKQTALAGNNQGPVIVPGKLDDSRLWQMLASDRMPRERAPLTVDEKQQLRQWIEDGAAWPLEVIDPALYAHGGEVAGTYVRRLTVDEYIATVRDAVGVDIEAEAREVLPRDVRTDGFTNTAYNLGVDLKHVDAYAQLAELIVDRMDVEAYVARFSKKRRLTTDDDMREVIERTGQWLLRGPLEEREVVSYCGIVTTVASAGGDFREAVSLVIAGMLQSPRFLYRIERQQGDGDHWPVAGHELASRMSYVLWGAPPDAELARLGAEGALQDSDVLAKQTARMLADPRAVARSREFVSQWLNLSRLSHLSPDRKRFPNWDDALAADMQAETLAFFEEVVWKQNRPLTDLLTAQVTFASPRLAGHYGLVQAADSGTSGSGPTSLARYDLTAVPGRGGLLTQGSVLTVGGDDASTVTRGLFVLHDFLRGVVRDPPPGVDTTPVPTQPGLTQRTIAEGRIENASCGGCHSRFEPLAFALERFDGLGTWRETDEHGNALREDGQLLIPGEAEPVSYQSTAELLTLLAGSDRVRDTITWKLTQFAIGRPLTARDGPALAKIGAAAQQHGGTYAAVMTAIVASELVQTIQTEQTSRIEN